jgi:hypothetical protein
MLQETTAAHCAVLSVFAGLQGFAVWHCTALLLVQDLVLHLV